MSRTKSKIDTPEMKERVRAAAHAKFGVESHDVFFEHGQWWVRFQPSNEGDPVAADRLFSGVFGEDALDYGEATFSVVDQQGGDAVDGFGFEAVY